VIFHNSLLVGVNVEESWLLEVVMVLNCKVGWIQFVYLCLPISGNPRRLSFWPPLIESIRKRLSSLKRKNLFMGGRLIMIKSILFPL